MEESLAPFGTCELGPSLTSVVEVFKVRIRKVFALTKREMAVERAVGPPQVSAKSFLSPER